MKSYETLTDEQLIKNFRDGDAQIMNFLMNKYKDMVRIKAKEMFLLGGDNDDLIQEGMIGLFKAIMDFDLSASVSFRHFADICITRQLYTAVKLSRRQKHIPLNSYVSIYEQSMNDNQELMPPLVEMITSQKENDPEELFLGKEYLEEVEQVLKTKLSEFENKVLYLHLLGTDYQTIANLLDKSPKSIDNALQRIKNKISKILKK